MLWNPESQNTPPGILKTVEYSLLCQRVQGESVLNKDPDVSERPSFIPPPTLHPPPDQASLVAQRVKRLPAMWKTRVQSLGQEDSLEKEMATHSSIIA